MSVNVKETLAEYAEMTERALEKYIPEMNGLQRTVVDAARYSLSAGGKRIRPALVMEFCRVCGEAPEKALPVACAVEMMHTASLIHDDLPCMDDDDLRRGKPSCHKAFGEAQAVLAGDYLMLAPFEVIAEAGIKGRISQDAALRITRLLSQLSGSAGMTGGQIIDLESEGKKVSETVILEMYRMKTGALLEFCCRAGCIAAGAGASAQTAAGGFGQRLGLAFQIVDDILDVTADEKLLGKPVGSDAKEQKCTYVSAAGLEKAKEQAKRLTEQAAELLGEFEDADFLRELAVSLTDRKF